MSAGAARSRPRPPPSARRPLPILSRPWPWLLVVSLLFGIPLVKALFAPLPAPLPGWDGEPLVLELPAEDGRTLRFSDLAGHLLVVGELPLANAHEAEWTFHALYRLRKRLRGLGSSVVFVLLAHGGVPADLVAALDAQQIRKPVHLFLWDENHEELDRLRRQAGSPSADFLLLDRHARVRGLYKGPRIEAGMSEDELDAAREQLEATFDALVADAGLLANWEGSDPEPGEPVTR